MGMTRGAIKLLAMTLQGQHYEKAVMYGVQQVSANSKEICSILSKYGANWAEPTLEAPSTGGFKSLGCNQVESIDFYPDEGATHVVDLNRPINEKYKQAFDLIYDGGTLEHCFDIAQVLRNTAHMLKTGGRIIHHVPTNNWVDHGFYQVSPTLFFDFYEAAGFSEFSFHFHFIDGKKESYISHSLQDQPPPYFIGKGTRVLSHFTAVKVRTVDPSDLVSLVQRRYREYFGGDHSPAETQSRDLLSRLKRSFLKRTIRLRAQRL